MFRHSTEAGWLKIILAISGDTRYHAVMKEFQSTQWSVVLAAKEEATAPAHQALSALCQTYWYPLFAFARRQGYEQEVAQDLTQSFFVTILERDFFKNVEPENGRFRHFLLAAFRKHLAHQYRTAKAQKRGGGVLHLSLDFESAEARYQNEPVSNVTPEQHFDRQWALTLFENTLQLLSDECEQDGKSDLFVQLKESLDGVQKVSHAEVAQQLGTTEGALRVAISRLRKRFGQLFRQQIAQTVAEAGEVDEEIRQVFHALQLKV